MERLNEGHLHPLLEEPETNMPRSGRAAGEYSSKELVSQKLVCIFGTAGFYGIRCGKRNQIHIQRNCLFVSYGQDQAEIAESLKVLSSEMDQAESRLIR